MTWYLIQMSSSWWNMYLDWYHIKSSSTIYIKTGIKVQQDLTFWGTMYTTQVPHISNHLYILQMRPSNIFVGLKVLCNSCNLYLCCTLVYDLVNCHKGICCSIILIWKLSAACIICKLIFSFIGMISLLQSRIAFICLYIIAIDFKLTHYLQ